MEHMILLFPCLGMEFDGLSLRFGDSRAEAEKCLGPAEKVRGPRGYYCGGQLALDFDGAGKLEFIEFLGGAEGDLQPDLYGHNVFHTDADELLALLKDRNGPDVDDSEADYAYALRKLSIGLYREITPADVEELVREMSRIDLTSLGHVNLEEERKRAHRWATVGIGRKHYYA